MEKEVIIASRYKIIRKIGEGGMAKVYLAYDQKMECDVALKILKKENVNDKKVRYFKREAQALSLMDDENIVKIYEIGEEGVIHYIANEFIDGMTLKDYIKACSPIPVEEVIDLTKQILLGLQHAHEKGVIHKDIKSQNILLDENKKIKITDFGIATIIDNNETKTQSLMGTPQYVAPEILNREELTEQSDIYSVGILMYEMLIGYAPFTGEKPSIIMIKQMNHPLPSIIEERNSVVQSVENVVIKASAKKLNNRYLNCEEMLNDLEIVFSEELSDVEKLVLEDDLLSEDKLEKTIQLNEELNYENLTEKNKEIKKKKRRKKIILGIIATILAISVLFFAFFRTDNNLEMINAIDKDVEIVINELTLMGIEEENIVIEYASHDFVEENKIIKTEPNEGEPINDDTKIILTVSTGPEGLVLADYSLNLSSNAKSDLESLGFTVIIEEVDSEYPSGTVVNQSPEAGTTLVKGSEVTLYVSTGVYEIIVIDLIGMTHDEARNWTQENGLNISTTYKCNDNVKEGEVYEQNPSHNTVVYPGDTINITISDGSCGSDVEIVD